MKVTRSSLVTYDTPRPDSKMKRGVNMNFLFTPEQTWMQQTVQEFAKTEVAKAVDRMEGEHRFPKELLEQMGTRGMLGIPIPKKYGGSGMDYTSYILAIHEISKVSPALGVILSVHTSVGTNPILLYGSEEQKNDYLPKLASGTYLGAFALTESEAGSDAGSLIMKARKEEDYFILNGSKAFITNGKEADTFIVFARTGEQGNTKDISAFIIEKTTPGLSIGKEEKKMGLHGSSTVEITFEDCCIPKDQLLGREGDGFQVAMANLNAGRIGIAAQALGIAEGVLDHTLAFMKKQKRFGSLMNRQAKVFKLVDLVTEVEAAKLLTYRAATLIEQGVACRKEVSMAKLYASKTAMKIAIEAIQIFGAYGYTKESPVERYFRDAKVTEIYEGTNEIQHIVIAKHL